MYKIGEFIYPWGSGHYSRMMRLNSVLGDHIKGELEIHYSSKDHVYQKLLEKFPENKEQIHEILMPTPIDGKFGPSVSLSMFNLLLPVSQNPPLVKQIASYLRQERKLYDTEKFDLVINDGDMGSNILANNRNIPSLFVTNQFMPKLYKSRSYFYPSSGRGTGCRRIPELAQARANPAAVHTLLGGRPVAARQADRPRRDSG